MEFLFPYSQVFGETILSRHYWFRLLSNFYGAMKCGQITILALFGVSTALDSVDHSILLQSLFVSYGLNGNNKQ